MENAILYLDQSFRGSPGNLDRVTIKVEHVRRWVCASEQPVGIEQASFHFGFQSVGKHDLENISFIYIVLCLFYHPAVGFFVK